jgi:pyrroloquinoline quinone biosynthesis protein D
MNTGASNSVLNGDALGLASQPRIRDGFRLQWEAAQDCHVLLYPEGMVKLNGSAGEIMKRCDGVRSVQDIVADIEQTYQLNGLQKDVLAFVELAGKQQWLQWT